MKRIIRIAATVALAVSLCGCNAVPDAEALRESTTAGSNTTENSTSQSADDNAATENATEELTSEYETVYEDILARQAYSVGSGIYHCKEPADGSRIEYKVDSEQAAFNAGMMIFINGIPQSFKDESGNSMYLSNVELDSYDSVTSYYTCEFNNVPKADKYVCRKVNMLMPQTIIVKRKNFMMGNLHSLSNGMEHEIECDAGSDVDVADIEFKQIEDLDDKSKRLISAGFNGDMHCKSVMERNAVIGECTVELYPQYSGEYVISFWGNGSPIQVGEHMFYRTYIEEGNRYSYTFELNEELVNSVDNFYVIACAVSEMGGIEKTSTNIFVDEYE